MSFSISAIPASPKRSYPTKPCLVSPCWRSSSTISPARRRGRRHDRNTTFLTGGNAAQFVRMLEEDYSLISVQLLQILLGMHNYNAQEAQIHSCCYAQARLAQWALRQYGIFPAEANSTGQD